MEPPMSWNYETETSLGQAMFGHAPVGDQRRVARLGRTLDALCSHTGGAAPFGQMGRGPHRAYICHNVLAVNANSGEVLGLVDQMLHCRDEVPDDETLPELRERDTRESLLWGKGTGQLPADARLVDVAGPGAGP